MACLKTGGDQRIGFDLTRPVKGWPVGDYEVRFVILTPHEYLEAFEKDSDLLESKCLKSLDRWRKNRFKIY